MQVWQPEAALPDIDLRLGNAICFVISIPAPGSENSSPGKNPASFSGGWIFDAYLGLRSVPIDHGLYAAMMKRRTLEVVFEVPTTYKRALLNITDE